MYMITSDHFNDADMLISNVEYQLKKGIKLVQLRIKSKKRDNYEDNYEDSYEFYANQLIRLCNQYSAKLVLNHSLKSFPNVDCFGIHITSSELMETQSIPDEIRKQYTISCPIHNYRELDQANELKLDFAILTPIQKSISHPDVPYIGWEQSATFLKRTDIPLYAAGGMTINDLSKAKELGFVGVACLGTLWRDTPTA